MSGERGKRIRDLKVGTLIGYRAGQWIIMSKGTGGAALERTKLERRGWTTDRTSVGLDERVQVIE